MLLKAQTNKQTNKKTKGELSHSRRRKEHFVFYFLLLLVHPPNASYVFFKRAKHRGASLFDHRFVLHNLKKKLSVYVKLASNWNHTRYHHVPLENLI